MWKFWLFPTSCQKNLSVVVENVFSLTRGTFVRIKCLEQKFNYSWNFWAKVFPLVFSTLFSMSQGAIWADFPEKLGDLCFFVDCEQKFSAVVKTRLYVSRGTPYRAKKSGKNPKLFLRKFSKNFWLLMSNLHPRVPRNI